MTGRAKSPSRRLGFWLLAIPVATWSVVLTALIITHASTAWWIGGVFGSVMISGLLFIPIFESVSKSWEPQHERITAEKAWGCRLSPQLAAERVVAALEPVGQVSQKADTINFSTGSNLHVRFWGVFNPIGRANFPTRLTVQVKPENGGANVTAVASDDLGWYLGPVGKTVKETAMNRNRELIEICRQATVTAVT